MSNNSAPTDFPDVLDDESCDELIAALQNRIHELWMPSSEHNRFDELEDEASDVAYDIVDDRGRVYPVDELNTDLRWEVEDLIYQRIDDRVEEGDLPHTEGYAHDALSEAVADIVAELMDDVAITEEDVYLTHTNDPVEPRYERSLGL